MLQLSEYDIFIFDCDGVIFDSNQLKIDAMRLAIKACSFNNEKVDKCINYFSANFGKSRFHHVDHFIENILGVSVKERDLVNQKILECYSSQCKSLYLEAELTPGLLNFLSSLDGKKYIASGSEQDELINIFEQRNLTKHFNEIYGSPTTKTDLVKKILRESNSSKALMFGDSLSDLDAAERNGVDFVGYDRFSNVKNILREKAAKKGFLCVECWGLV